MDSNHRPLGYEPNELPTAPPRDQGLKYNIFNGQSQVFFCEILWVIWTIFNLTFNKKNDKIN